MLTLTTDLFTLNNNSGAGVDDAQKEKKKRRKKIFFITLYQPKLEVRGRVQITTLVHIKLATFTFATI